MRAILVILIMFLSMLPNETLLAAKTARNNSLADSTKYAHSTTTTHPTSTEKSRLKRPVALKSNLLHWAAAIPNVSVEFYLSSRLSLGTEIDFAWWSDESSLFCWQGFAASPELRYWFSKSRFFRGHYVGVYASGGFYDGMFKPLTGEKGYQGEFYAAGLSYGYVFPIGKQLSLELGLGIGYMATKYREYVWQCSDFMRTDTKRTIWVGPTKINLMLVWTI